jgi:hypothetical protein
MAITINGTGSITGLTAGGLPDGSIVAGDLASSLDLTGKTVTLPSGTGGKILQVVQAVKTDVFSESVANGATSGDAMSASITPSATSSKILIVAQLTLSLSSANKVTATLFKDGSKLNAYTGDASNNRLRVSAATSVANTWRMAQASPIYLDSPSSTSAITYSFRLSQGIGGTATVYLNRSHDDEDQVYQMRSASTITLLEVAG